MCDAERLLAHLITGQEAERHELAATIHTDLLQVLSALNLQIAAARRLLDGQTDVLDGVDEALQESLSLLRRLLVSLEPPALHECGVAAALRRYARQSFEPGELRVEIHDTVDVDLPLHLRTTLYRIGQEILSEIRRDGQTDVRISIHNTDDRVLLRIEGSHPYIPSMDTARHLENTVTGWRAAMAGGSLRIQREAGRPAVFRCHLPLSPRHGTERRAIGRSTRPRV